MSVRPRAAREHGGPSRGPDTVAQLGAPVRGFGFALAAGELVCLIACRSRGLGSGFGLGLGGIVNHRRGTLSTILTLWPSSPEVRPIGRLRTPHLDAKTG